MKTSRHTSSFHYCRVTPNPDTLRVRPVLGAWRSRPENPVSHTLGLRAQCWKGGVQWETGLPPSWSLHARVLRCFSHVRLFATPWTISCQAPLSMGFSGQAYWSGLPRPPPGDCPDLGIEPVSLLSPALAGSFTTSTTWEAPFLTARRT